MKKIGFAFHPKLLDCFKNYNRSAFFSDICAGISVGILALPLAMAFAIASGVTPEQGLYTAIVAGFIIPLLMYLFYQIFMSEKQSMKWAAPLYALSFAAALLSGMGIIMAPVMMGLYGLLDGIYHRNLKRMLCIWIAALPCAVYMIYYTAGI